MTVGISILCRKQKGNYVKENSPLFSEFVDSSTPAGQGGIKYKLTFPLLLCIHTISIDLTSQKIKIDLSSKLEVEGHERTGFDATHQLGELGN